MLNFLAVFCSFDLVGGCHGSSVACYVILVHRTAAAALRDSPARPTISVGAVYLTIERSTGACVSQVHLFLPVFCCSGIGIAVEIF